MLVTCVCPLMVFNHYSFKIPFTFSAMAIFFVVRQVWSYWSTPRHLQATVWVLSYNILFCNLNDAQVNMVRCFYSTFKKVGELWKHLIYLYLRTSSQSILGMYFLTLSFSLGLIPADLRPLIRISSSFFSAAVSKEVNCASDSLTSSRSFNTEKH